MHMHLLATNHISCMAVHMQSKQEQRFDLSLAICVQGDRWQNHIILIIIMHDEMRMMWFCHLSPCTYGASIMAPPYGASSSTGGQAGPNVPNSRRRPNFVTFFEDVSL